MTEPQTPTYDVGGVRLPRPFQIRRFGHFGYNCRDLDAMLAFYAGDLGLVVSDRSDRILGRQADEVADTFSGADRYLHFLRAGTDHHQLVLMSTRLWDLVPANTDRATVNQVTWQVGSMVEVMAAADYLHGRGASVMRVGRDMPGSNWHTYLYDAERFIHELYYGMEQVGWDRRSKPREMWLSDGATSAPLMPVDAEHLEVQQAVDAGLDLGSGFRPSTDDDDRIFDVDGLRLSRPFKVVRVGPVSLYCRSLDAAVSFHTDVLGFEVRGELAFEGHRGVQLGTGTDHHQMTLYEESVRSLLGRSDDRDAMALGLQVANYRQLREAVVFLEQRGAKQVPVPPELVPGFSHVAHLADPDGNLVQLYYAMEQFAPRTTGSLPSTDPSEWEPVIDAPAMPFAGEQFLGPWS